MVINSGAVSEFIDGIEAVLNYTVKVVMRVEQELSMYLLMANAADMLLIHSD